MREPKSNRGTTWPVRLAVTGLVIATPVATWWLVGDQSEVPVDGSDLGYAFGPVALDPVVERLIGIGSVLVIAAAVPLLVRASVRHQFDPRWWAVVAPMVAVGVIVGLGWRVMTAGVVGANIGAGFSIMFGGPLVLGLLLWAGLWSRQVRKRVIAT